MEKPEFFHVGSRTHNKRTVGMLDIPTVLFTLSKLLRAQKGQTLVILT